MSYKRRILVVENLSGLREQYMTGLEFAGFIVDSAASLQEAIDLVEAKTFHVALVDLMLNDPYDTTKDGLEVLKKLRELGEGTKRIVLSGQDSPGTAADTITEYRADKYIQKIKILNEGMEYLVKEVSELAKSAEIKKYGDNSSIVSVLAGSDINPLVWADPFLRILKPKERANGFNQFLMRFCEPLVPLMPQRGVTLPLELHQESRFANGRFWSKGLGCPVELVVCRVEEATELLQKENNPVWKSKPLIKPYERYGLKGYAFALPNEVARSEFVGNL